jgi:hypothetical protein
MGKTKLTRYRLLLAFPLALLAALVLFVPAALAAESPPPTPAVGWSMGDVMALIALIVAGAGLAIDAARGILHFTAPRTESTWDDRAAAALDELHNKLADIESRLPPPPKAPTIGPVAVLALVLLGLGAAAGATGCGGSMSSRAATLGSLQSGVQTLSGSLRAYERQHANEIIDAAPDKPTGVAQLKAFRDKTDKAWLAVDVARAAIDAANTLNDDPSLAGARQALANAIDAVTLITQGTGP